MSFVPECLKQATDGSPEIMNNTVPVCLLYVHHLICFIFVNINNDAPSRLNSSSDELRVMPLKNNIIWVN